MTDKIAEIRARHERDNRYGDGLYPGAHKDRAWLLAEVERLTSDRDEARAFISTLEIVGKAADDERAQLRAEVERLHAELRAMTAGFEVAYHALGAKP